MAEAENGLGEVVERDPGFAEAVDGITRAVEKALDHHSNTPAGADFPLPNGAIRGMALSTLVGRGVDLAEDAKAATTQKDQQRREEEARRWELTLTLGGNGE